MTVIPDFAAGYFIQGGVLSSSDCNNLLQALADTGRTRAGTRHLMSSSAVASLANDSRLATIAARVLGGSAIPFRATLFEKTGRANWLVPWHQDTALPLSGKFDDPAWGPWSEKSEITYAHAPTWALSRVVALRLHLDDSTTENGPLRVIAGSHRNGVMTDAAVADYARTHPHDECLTPRGGVLAMSPMIIHSSSKLQSDLPRRVLHVEYADSLDLGPGIRLRVA